MPKPERKRGGVSLRVSDDRVAVLACVNDRGDVFLQEACRGRLAMEDVKRVLSRCTPVGRVDQLQSSSNQSTRFSMRTPCSVVPSRRRSVVSTSLGKASFTREKGANSRSYVSGLASVSVTWM